MTYLPTCLPRTRSERVRSRLAAIGEADLASQDVLIEVVRELEKLQWMLRFQLGERA
jgi:starvation-inducible DNA-binding protein